jgi:predicted nucleotidyltransferase
VPERSDVDFLVAFERPEEVSPSEFFALRDALSATVGRPVDLVTEGSVRNPFIRTGIERSVELIYGS